MPVFALQAVTFDRTAPVQIQSDQASFEQMNRVAIHEGNVILIQGNHELRADKITIQQDKNGRLNVITAIGKPAAFTGRRPSDPNPVYATAKTIYYYPVKQLVVLDGQAILEHEKDKFQGPSLSYQLDKQVISASRTTNERPTITIHPRA